MFALVDCNAFFVSCERVFQPHLEGKPVIVLSSNDGCAISRSAEAKALGIQMGVPFFKIKDIIKKHHIYVFSSNFSLYRDMSSRVMETLQTLAPAMEVYSIDEAFLDLSSFPQNELLSHGYHIKQRIKQWTGIPVSVGIGRTKTLAKVANHVAKKRPLGCTVLIHPENIGATLKTLPLQDVWGIGSQWSKKLTHFGLKTAWDLSQADLSWVRSTFSIVLARTALELKGIPCLQLEDISPKKKSMISSCSFGTPLTSFESLREALSFHASRLAQKLRQQHSKTSLIGIMIRSNPFDKKGKFYTNTHLVPLSFPSQASTTLMKATTTALKKIFKEGISYKKAGVTVFNLSPETQAQPFLFKGMGGEDSPKQKALLQTIDQVNEQYGKRSLAFASEGIKKTWQPKRSTKSASFTRRWTQLPTVR